MHISRWCRLPRCRADFAPMLYCRLVGDASYDVDAQMTGEDFRQGIGSRLADSILTMPTVTVLLAMCSFLTEAMPAAYFHLGVGNVTVGSTSELHTPTFKIDEAVRLLP